MIEFRDYTDFLHLPWPWPIAKQVEVHLLITRVLKNGKGYGKPYTLPFYETRGARLQKAAQPVDHAIVRLLASMQGAGTD